MPFVKRNNGEESKATGRAMFGLTGEVHYRQWIAVVILIGFRSSGGWKLNWAAKPNGSFRPAADSQ